MTDTLETTDRAQGLQVIGAGFGRTGTRSLKEALEELGYGPCYHMVEVFEHPEHAPLWEAAARGQSVDWDTLLAHYRSTVDWPGCTFYAALMEKYPDAKVLLSVREPEKWHESVMSTIYATSNMLQPSLSNALRRLTIRIFAPQVLTVLHMINTLIWQGTFHNKAADKDYAISVYNRHIEEVKSRVPAERLLVYSVKEGWGPLCAFLGVPVPQKPFPHLNDRLSFNQRRRPLGTRPLISGALVAGAAALALVIGLLRRAATRAKKR